MPEIFLICDVHVRQEGHNLGYVKNIIRYIEQHPQPERIYYFLFNPAAEALVNTSASHIRLHFLNEEQFAPYASGVPTPKNMQQLWQHIEAFAQQIAATQLLLLNLDLFQLAVGTSKLTIPTSGILLTPVTRISPHQAGLKGQLTFYRRKWQKQLTTWWMLRNKYLHKIFILNDLSSVSELNKQFRTTAFHYLPDPVYDYPFDATLQVRQQYNIAPHRKIFLSFGMIDEKKNVVNLLKAAMQLSAAEASQYCFLIVGKVGEGYKKPLQEAIAEAQKQQPNLQIVSVSHFVSDEAMESFVMQSDVVSLAYINFYSSSGVIGLAARHNKPIIATNLGVVGEQTLRYGLGLTADARNVASLTAALQHFLAQPNAYPTQAATYVSDHSPEAFMQTLLGVGC